MEVERVADGSAPVERAAATPAQAMHIVDTLFQERAPKLFASPFWPIVRPPLYTILNYNKARLMADTIAPMSGRDAIDHIAQLLSVQLDLKGLERTPRGGSFVALCNHPTGITDGIAVYDAIRRVRPDVLFYANSDAHRVCTRFDETLIPVEWVLAKRTRERTRTTLRMTEKAVGEGRPIVIFPAGRLARIQDGVLVDPEWMASAVSIARKYDLPIVPIAVAGPYAFWFHTFAKFSGELRDITLFHELLNKRGKTYRLNFGPTINTDAIGGDATSVTRRIKYYVERVLLHDPDAKFDPAGPECSWREPD